MNQPLDQRSGDGSVPRYAVYFMPPADSPLWQWGAAVIGFDAATQRPVSPPEPEIGGLLSDGVQSEPRRYGFHATLRAPFELAPGRSLAELLDAAHAFAAHRIAPPPAKLVPRSIQGFVALTPSDPSPELDQLASDVVVAFEPFRAPLSEADMQRRLKAPLTPRQLQHLSTWGYPYVFEDFAFHMTLTGRLPTDIRGAVLDRIETSHRAVADPVAIDAITVVEQPRRDGPFRIMERYAFAG